MSLRHDDDLPPLTPGQQAKAIRLAARLQEEETTRHDLLRAAEEAGIEPRFMREAAHRIAKGPVAHAAPEKTSDTLDWAKFGLLVVAFIGVPTAILAHDRMTMGHGMATPLVLMMLLCAVLASFWVRRGRTLAFVMATQIAAWLALDLVLDTSFGGPPNLGAYLPVLAAEAMLSFVGISFAWSAKALLDARGPHVGHNNPKA